MCSLEFPTLSLLSMRFVMRSHRMDMGPGGRTECCNLLNGLHDMVPDFLEKIRIQFGMYRKIQHNPQGKITYVFMYREYFFSPYPERERNTEKTITVIDDNRVLNDILPEMDYRKEWDNKKYRENIAAWKGNCRYHQEFFFL